MKLISTADAIKRLNLPHRSYLHRAAKSRGISPTFKTLGAVRLAYWRQTDLDSIAETYGSWRDPSKAPTRKGCLTLSEYARELGISRQLLHQRIGKAVANGMAKPASERGRLWLDAHQRKILKSARAAT